MREDMKFRNAVNGFNKSDVMSCIEDLLEEIDEYKKRIKELENSLVDSRASLAQTKAECDTKDMCANCDAAKAAQAQLGAAMLDAKRFSELLLKDANDKAATVLNNAAGHVQNSTEQANLLADALKQAKENFAATLDALQDELAGVILSFLDFKTNVETKGLNFVYETDFAAAESGADK